MSDLEDLEGRGRAVEVEEEDLGPEDEEMSDARLLENAKDEADDMGLCLVLEGSFTPYNDESAISLSLYDRVSMN
jgi:hypothetical protein